MLASVAKWLLPKTVYSTPEPSVADVDAAPAGREDGSARRCHPATLRLRRNRTDTLRPAASRAANGVPASPLFRPSGLWPQDRWSSLGAATAGLPARSLSPRCGPGPRDGKGEKGAARGRWCGASPPPGRDAQAAATAGACFARRALATPVTEARSSFAASETI